MSRPKDSVIKALRRELPRGARVLLAVSGGMDSVSLLHGCVHLARALSVTIEVAHVDHALRATSRAHAQFVRKVAQSHELVFHLKRLRAPRTGTNLEAWGRDARYKYFSALLKKRTLDWIVTAHTADDVAETFLMRLFANKEPKSILRVDQQRRCLRPFLAVTRSEIERYITAHKVKFVEDETNSDTRFLRNRVRHRLMPILRREFDPNIVEVLSQRALAIADDIHLLNNQCAQLVQALRSYEFGSKSWLHHLRGELHRIPAGLQWRLAEQVFRDSLHFNLGKQRSLLVLRLLRGEVSGVEIPPAVRLRAKGGGIELLSSVTVQAIKNM